MFSVVDTGVSRGHLGCWPRITLVITRLRNVQTAGVSTRMAIAMPAIKSVAMMAIKRRRLSVSLETFFLGDVELLVIVASLSAVKTKNCHV